MSLSRKSNLGNPWKSLEKPGLSSLLTPLFGELCPFGFGGVCPSVSLETWLLEAPRAATWELCWPGSFGRIICFFKALSDGSAAEENRQEPETWMK